MKLWRVGLVPDGNHRGGKAAPKRDEVAQILEEGHILGSDGLPVLW